MKEKRVSAQSNLAGDGVSFGRRKQLTKNFVRYLLFVSDGAPITCESFLSGYTSGKLCYEKEATMLTALIKNLSPYVCLVAAGCAAAPEITKTPRSSIEQKLLVRALERALDQLDAAQFEGKNVAVEFYGLTPDKDFAREFFIAWLQSRRVRIAANMTHAQLRLKVFASVLSVDRGQSFIGLPAFTVPVVGFVFPEISLFKDVKHVGHAEIRISTTDAETGEFVSESAPSAGKAHHDDYTMLIVVHFTHTDLEEERQWDLGQ